MSGIQDIACALCEIRDPAQMQRFLQEILTPAEMRDLALRWELMTKLDRGVAQRQIASELGVSLCKITRGAKILKSEGSICKQLLSGRRTS